MALNGFKRPRRNLRLSQLACASLLAWSRNRAACLIDSLCCASGSYEPPSSKKPVILRWFRVQLFIRQEKFLISQSSLQPSATLSLDSSRYAFLNSLLLDRVNFSMQSHASDLTTPDFSPARRGHRLSKCDGRIQCIMLESDSSKHGNGVLAKHME